MGGYSLPTIHPVDYVRVEPLLHAVIQGDAAEAQYSARLIGHDGLWHNHHCIFRPLVAAAGSILMSQIRELSNVCNPIDTSAFDERDLDFLDDLFAGLGIGDIARLRHLSVKTVRNRLSALYSRLGVGSAQELLSTVDPPDRLQLHPTNLRPTPVAGVHTSLSRANGTQNPSRVVNSNQR